MPRIVAITAVVLALAACGDDAPTPPPAPPATPPKPIVSAPPAAAPAAVPAAQAAAAKADPNAELAGRVKRALEDEGKIQAAAIDVTAADGKVTLWGTASTDGERSRAAHVAGKVQGVTAVENKIAVVRGS